jgi:hypothetical protein
MVHKFVETVFCPIRDNIRLVPVAPMLLKNIAIKSNRKISINMDLIKPCFMTTPETAFKVTDEIQHY